MLVFRYIANAIKEDEHFYRLLAAELLGSYYIVSTLILDKKTRTWVYGNTRIVRRICLLKEYGFIVILQLLSMPRQRTDYGFMA